MRRIRDFYRSAVGKKAVMAVTGIVLFGFVLGHMLGNLKLYQGAEKLNAYAEFLRQVGQPFFPPGQLLWLARMVLLAAVALHIHAAVLLTFESWRARPVGYRKRSALQADYASRTMRWGGPIIALFVLYHLLHFTVGSVHPGFIAGDVYHNVVVGFQNGWVSAFYLLAQGALGLHLYHGLWSLFQSLGWSHPRFNRGRRIFAVVFAAVVVAGNVSFPLAVLTGLVS